MSNTGTQQIVCRIILTFKTLFLERNQFFPGECHSNIVHVGYKSKTSTVPYTEANHFMGATLESSQRGFFPCEVWSVRQFLGERP